MAFRIWPWRLIQGKNILLRKPRPPKERIFNRIMVERTIIAALVIGIVSFCTFGWMVEVAGWSEDKARNGLLLLMVLFENIHIQNCRSELTSAFRMSLLNSPILVIGTALAFTIHMISMHIPLMQDVLHIEPVDLPTFGILVLLAMSVIAAIELHKLWRRRVSDKG